MRRPALLAAAFALTTAGAASAADAPAPKAPTYVATSLAVEPGTPRTRDGHPDLQSVVWDARFFAPLQRSPKGVAALVLPEEEARKVYETLSAPLINAPFLALDPEAGDLLATAKGLPIVRGQRHSRLLVMPADGRLPLTPQAQSEIQPSRGAAKTDNPENRSTMEQCLSMGANPPMTMLTQIDPWAFVVTRDHVVIHTEDGDEVRIVPFATDHAPRTTSPDFGDSIARWNGDTLVIETTHFLARDRIRGALPGTFIVNPEATVIERFTRVSRDELVYQFTVVDPQVYAAPWLAEFSAFRAPYRMFPSECHEGNYGLPNILAGARAEERAAAVKAANPTP